MLHEYTLQGLNPQASDEDKTPKGCKKALERHLGSPHRGPLSKRLIVEHVLDHVSNVQKARADHSCDEKCTGNGAKTESKVALE